MSSPFVERLLRPGRVKFVRAVQNGILQPRFRWTEEFANIVAHSDSQSISSAASSKLQPKNRRYSPSQRAGEFTLPRVSFHVGDTIDRLNNVIQSENSPC